ncbi:MAG: hypothetical protein ACI9XC_000760 [Gammaproteobacteria bacterium]|jgi:hypothetical protein
MNKNKYYIFICLLFLGSNYATATPTGKDLLFACSKSIESGFNSIEGQMCTWYVIPCDCNANIDVPQACLPENIEITSLANIVIEGINQTPELENEYAALSAAIILSKNYPCTGQLFN